MSSRRFLVAASLLALVAAQPASPSRTASPSVGATPTPSPSARPVPVGTVREVAVLDCNGGLHVLPGHPFELNANLRGFKALWDIAMEEVADKARCAAAAAQCALTEDDIERHFIPGPAMMLHYYAPAFEKSTRGLPAACQTSTGGAPDGLHPAFPRTFWDDTAWSTIVMPLVFNMTRIMPESVNFPPTCTYETYMGGVGCTMELTETVSGTSLLVGVDKCPNSYLPYVSVSCRGPYCENLGRPCEPADLVNVRQQCGNSGLVCRSTEVQIGAGPNDQLLTWLRNYGVIGSNAWETDSCAGGLPSAGSPLPSRSAIYVRLRDKLMTLFNSSIPLNPNPAPPPDLSFCLPPQTTVDAMEREEQRMWTDRTLVDITNDETVQACVNTGCDPTLVGDGECNLVCRSAACKWDGGDCGGPPQPPEGNQAPVRDTTLPAACVVVPAVAGRPYNLWEACNGAGTCVNAVLGCQGTCMCEGALSPRWVPADGPGPQCGNCQPPRYCGPNSLPGPPCSYSVAVLRGVQAVMRAWPGVMYDGMSVLDGDRKSGLMWATPAAVFEVSDQAMNAFSGGLAANARPVMQSTCAGEIGFSLPNQVFQVGVHMPVWQDGVQFLQGWINDIAQCRLTAWATQFGIVNVPPWTPAQLDTRFSPASIAFWLYQYTHFGSSGGFPNSDGISPRLTDPLVQPNQRGDGQVDMNTLQQRFGVTDGAGRNFGFVSATPATSSYVLQDIANQTWGREPMPLNPNVAPPVYAPLLFDTPWGKRTRFMAPVDNDCDYVSATDRQNFNILGGNRRCRARFRAFGALFPQGSAVANVGGVNINDRTVHDLHLHIQADGVCENTPTGQRFPIPTPVPLPNGLPGQWGPTPTPTPTLLPAEAKRAVPMVTGVYAGALTAMLSNPTPCTGVADFAPDPQCVAQFGPGAYCVDVDALFGISPYFNPLGRNVDPFALPVYGQYNANRGGGSCSSQFTLRRTIRQTILAAGGKPRDSGVDPYFCFLNPNVIRGNTFMNWRDRNYLGGTCTQYQENSASPGNNAWGPGGIPPFGEGLLRNCMRTNAVPVGPTATPRPAGFPARLNFVGPERNFFTTIAAAGVSNFVPNMRQQGTYAGGATRSFTLSLPTWTVRDFRNKEKERLRYALSRLFILYGYPITPDMVLITSVADNPMAFAPLPGNIRAGMTVLFTLDVPSVAMLNNATADMQSNVLGSLGSQAGPLLASLGIVSFRFTREVAFRQFNPPPAAAAVAGGLIAGVVIGVGLVAAGAGFFVYRAGGLSAAAASVGLSRSRAPRGAKEAARKSMGGVVESVGGPDRRPSTAAVGVGNPIAVAAAAAAAAAAPAEPAAVDATLVDVPLTAEPPQVAAPMAAPAPAAYTPPAFTAPPVPTTGAVAANPFLGGGLAPAPPAPAPAAPYAPAPTYEVPVRRTSVERLSATAAAAASAESTAVRRPSAERISAAIAAAAGAGAAAGASEPSAGAGSPPYASSGALPPVAEAPPSAEVP